MAKRHGYKLRAKKLPKLHKQLLSCRPRRLSELSGVPDCGIYVFIENGKALYVGKTDRMLDRLEEHGDERSPHNKAGFAFMIAREQAKTDGINLNMTRNDLCNSIDFLPYFIEAKRKVSGMKIKYIEVTDPVDQYLLEVYTALELNTPYNDFANH